MELRSEVYHKKCVRLNREDRVLSENRKNYDENFQKLEDSVGLDYEFRKHFIDEEERLNNIGESRRRELGIFVHDPNPEKKGKKPTDASYAERVPKSNVRTQESCSTSLSCVGNTQKKRRNI